MKAAVDSREVQSGDTFYALQGKRADGHQFLEHAAQQGAVAAVVLEKYEGSSYGLELQRVPDVLAQLQEEAKRRFQTLQRPLLAVTGSVGKTTTRQFLSTLLRERWNVAESLRSQNGQIGLPLSILGIRDNPDFLALEMGMSTKGQLRRLIDIAPPSVALITTVSYVHAENFTSLRDIALAKGEILTHPKTKLAIIGQECPYLSELKGLGSCDKLTYSVRFNRADYFGIVRFGQMEVYERGQHLLSCPWRFRGEHTAFNFVGAVAVALSVGSSVGQVITAAAKLTLPPLRGEMVERGGVHYFLDCYNACALSTRAALSALPRPPLAGRAFAFLGEMGELGLFCESSHKEVGEHALGCVDELICFGLKTRPMAAVWENEGRQFRWFATRTEAFAYLLSQVQQGDVVLVKGSRVHSLEELIDSL